MLALSSEATVALIGAASVIVAGLIAGAFQLAAVSRKLNTGNGHSIGQAVSFIEEKLMHHDNRLDRIEVKVDEGNTAASKAVEVAQEAAAIAADSRGMLRAHLEEASPLIERAKVEWPDAG